MNKDLCCAFEEGILYTIGLLVNMDEPYLAVEILLRSGLEKMDITLLDNTEKYALMHLDNYSTKVAFTWDGK